MFWLKPTLVKELLLALHLGFNPENAQETIKAVHESNPNWAACKANALVTIFPSVLLIGTWYAIFFLVSNFYMFYNVNVNTFFDICP